ncbi:4-hydroxytryptamine kinase-like protein [Cladobotryum mycophilum]|uniref:4-hydroxytryptamine kinase-like protein n=1 Tax=Cladobotryum mycophilum TaxID=491253 RepID=A0ABR0SX88_9HYPO
MTIKTAAEIETAVKAELDGTAYAVSSLRPLTGGNANFIYHAKLRNPLSNGTTDVAIKHGEAYVALSPDFALTMTRCQIEVESLRFLSQLPHSTSRAFQVGTPKQFYFNPETSTQIQEYLPNAVSLKQYAIEHYKAPTPEALKPQCIELGRCLGKWLRTFHDWSQQPVNSGLREIFARNKDMQKIKKMVNYDQLLGMVGKYPSILEDSRDVLQQIAEMASGELKDEANLHVIHGDFWTGNVLLPNTAIEDGSQIHVRIVDWEMSQLGVQPEDLGQIIAELWELKLYKDIDAGLWVIQGFMEGYGKVGAEFIFRTILHVGAHLICFGSTTPGWGTTEQAEQVAKVGKDVLLKAWKKDPKGFEGHELECLFE